jgi:hypothetical protein
MSQDAETRRAKENAPEEAAETAQGGRRSISMHEDIAVWCDCCSCKAEPYWVSRSLRRWVWTSAATMKTTRPTAIAGAAAETGVQVSPC